MDQILKKPFFERERIRGFIYSFSAFAVLEIARQLIVFVDGRYVEMIPSLFSGVIFLVALFSLNDRKYKKYAQGALIAWLVIFIGTMLSITYKYSFS
jgi:hypothetical protein